MKQAKRLLITNPVPRTYAYCRVSTEDQTTDNQLVEITGAGFHIEPCRMVSEFISGGSGIAQRKGFLKLLNRMEPGDIIVVTKMDRLGRNAIDVANTVTGLAERGIKVHCLPLGGTDLTSPAGKMITGMSNIFAEFERDILVERTQAGLERAKVQARHLGLLPG